MEIYAKHRKIKRKTAVNSPPHGASDFQPLLDNPTRKEKKKAPLETRTEGRRSDE
jgi:hypothetical protein